MILVSFRRLVLIATFATLAACGPGSTTVPETTDGSGELSNIDGIGDLLIENETIDQSPGLGAGTPVLTVSPSEPDQSTDSVDSTSVGLSPTPESESSATAVPSNRLPANFSVQLISVDVRRVHDGQSLDVMIDETQSESLRIEW